MQSKEIDTEEVEDNDVEEDNQLVETNREEDAYQFESCSLQYGQN